MSIPHAIHLSMHMSLSMSAHLSVPMPCTCLHRDYTYIRHMIVHTRMCACMFKFFTPQVSDSHPRWMIPYRCLYTCLYTWLCTCRCTYQVGDPYPRGMTLLSSLPEPTLVVAGQSLSHLALFTVGKAGTLTESGAKCAGPPNPTTVSEL